MSSGERVPAKTWSICFALFLATAVVYLDRQVLALTAQKIIAEFRLSNEQFGQIVAAFRYSYGVVQILGGFLVDRWGAGIIFPVAGGVWSLAGLLTGLATTVGMLTGLRFLLGAGEAFNWPCALKITNTLLSPKDRPLANGIFNSGAVVGALVGPVVVTVIAIHWSWRAAFVMTGAAGGLWLLAWLWLSRDVSGALGGMPVSAGKLAKAAGRLLAMPQFWILAVCALVINSVNYYLADWVPLYLQTARGFSFARGNALSIVVYGGTLAGNLLVGLFVRLQVSRGSSTENAKLRALLAACLLMLCAVAAGLSPWPYAAVALLAMTGMGAGAFLVIYLTLVQDLDAAYVGISAGLLGGLSNIAYGAVSRYIGLLADRHDTYMIFMLMGILPWFAFGAIFLGSRAQQR